MRTRHFLSIFIAALTAVWAWDALVMHPMTGDWPWLVQRHALYLTGIWSIGLMSLVMVLATRPVWLEGPLGGMDKIYQAHKWAGILAVLFGAAHWLIKLGSGPLSALIGKEGRPTKEVALFFAQSWRSPAKDLGEWALYILLGLIVIALWKRIPYRPWRALHRAMPVLYLLLVFHTVALLPANYWAGLTGALTAVLLLTGSVSACLSLTQRIGRTRRHEGRITFEIKALGDYTRQLAHRLQVGQAVCVEGPYGRLDARHGREDAAQVWVAGGIGITPFLAWLENAQREPLKTPVQMHYCVRDAGTD